MAIQDARQMFTTLMGQRQQRREGARNRLFQGILSAGSTLSSAMEARRDREFEAEQKRLDRKNRLGVEAKRQSNQMAVEDKRAENEHDLFLKQLGLPDGINSTPEEIADAFKEEQRFRLNLAGAGRVHVDTGAKSPTQHLMEAVGNVVDEELLVYNSLAGAPENQKEALFAALLAKVERVFAEQQGRLFTDKEREIAEGQLRVELEPPPAATPTQETFVADDGDSKGDAFSLSYDRAVPLIGSENLMPSERDAWEQARLLLSKAIESGNVAHQTQASTAGAFLVQKGDQNLARVQEMLNELSRSMGLVSSDTANVELRESSVDENTLLSLGDSEISVLEDLDVGRLSEEEKALVNKAIEDGEATKAEIDALKEIIIRLNPNQIQLHQTSQ